MFKNRSIFVRLLLSLSFVFPMGSLTIFTTQASTNIDDEKIYCNATLQDSFSDDDILVVLDKEASFSDKDYTVHDFIEYGCTKVTDLTSAATKVARNETVNNLVDISKYNRVLKVELEKNSKENVLTTINELMERQDVLYAGPDYVIQENASNSNDEYLDEQWAIENVYLPQAYDFVTGSHEVVVGVLDSGIDATHPDLVDVVDRGLSRDFLSGQAQTVTVPTDPWGHGTNVAGIIGAAGNNGIGVTGVCWNVKLVSLRVFNDRGRGNSSFTAAAIAYAMGAHIDILNLSASWYDRPYNEGDYNVYDVALDSIIQSYSGLFVCSAGNDGQNNDGDDPRYPAGYNLDNLISVGAINSNDERATFRDGSSNYGLNTVDIYAPGKNIYSTYPMNLQSGSIQGYEYYSGTSQAAPHVAGVAALLLSYNPDLTTAQIKAAILNGADTIDISTPAGTQSVKKLNAFKALRYAMNYYGETATIANGTRVFEREINTEQFFVKNNFMLGMNIQDEYNYSFYVSSNRAMKVSIYDSNFNLIRATNVGAHASITQLLSIGKYYLRVQHVNTAMGVWQLEVTINGDPHVHSYTDRYARGNDTHHKAYCECGEYMLKPHVVIVGDGGVGNTCTICGLIVGGGLLNPLSMAQAQAVTANGSFIAPNGIIYLVEEDVEAYFAGTLAFNDRSSLPVTRNLEILAQGLLGI